MNAGASTSSATRALSSGSQPTGHGLCRIPSRSVTVIPRVHVPSASTSTRVEVQVAIDGSIARASASGSCMHAPPKLWVRS